MKTSRTLAFACMLGISLNALSPTISHGETVDRMPMEAAFSKSPNSPDNSGGRARHPRTKLIAVIADWLSTELDLPKMARDPTIAFVSKREMHAMRYQDVSGEHIAGHAGNIVALYHDKLEIVFLSDDWSGSNYSELSVLVHELTHHLQKLSAMRFGCPEEREKLAYEAQAKWLALFQSDLETEFEMDAFTLLVKTSCLY